MQNPDFKIEGTRTGRIAAPPAMPPFVAVDDDHLTEDEKRERANLIANILNVRRNRLTGRFTTKWGSKNSLGLYETIRNLIQEGK